MLDKKKWKSQLSKARRGDDEAQWYVASFYHDGYVDNEGNTIVQKDIKRAAHWYRLSAEQGNTSSQIGIGILYSTQDGIDLDFEKALNWTMLAYENGDKSAAHNIATIYRDKEQYRKAFSWYKRSVKHGFWDSLLEYGMCLYFGIGTKK